MRFLRLSPALQASTAAILLVAAGWTLVTSLHFLTGDMRVAAKERQLDYVSSELDALLVELARLQDEALTRTERLERRQALLDSLIGTAAIADETASPGEDLGEPDGVTTGSVPSSDRVERHSALDLSPPPPSVLAAFLGAPSATAAVASPAALVGGQTDLLLQRLGDVENLQEETAGDLAERERRRITGARTLFERLGLNLPDILRTVHGENGGLGGPMFGLKDTQSSNFSRLAEELGVRRSLDQAIASLPSREPSDNYYVSSRFGQRKDPFSKRWAMHSGVDMAGWPGEPIFAANEGLVLRAGRMPAYGLMVEIDHGNGFRTRYGHMRKITVKAGQRVTRGDKVGEMGTSGRSTSTHLHWEVWFAGKLVDPLPFLKASKDVHALQRRNDES